MILVAIPTNGQRNDQLEQTIANWRKHTCQPITFHVTTYGDTWASGLNDAWENYPEADIFVCGSDDIWPEDDRWLPTVVESLDKGESPVPKMLDPRFTIHGGSIPEVPDGHHSHMTNFPVLKAEWLSSVFRLPDELHYFSDNVIADRLHAIGVQTVYREAFVVRHAWDERGRGAGMGDESTRMAHDRSIYRQLQK